MPLEKQATVKFDPTKKVHRESAAAFLRRRSWNDSPLRFSHDPTYGSIADQVEKKLLAFYMSKDKLNIPVPHLPPTSAGSIVDGIAPKSGTVHVVITNPVINKQLMPRVRHPAANDEKKFLTFFRPKLIDIKV